VGLVFGAPGALQLDVEAVRKKPRQLKRDLGCTLGLALQQRRAERPGLRVLYMSGYTDDALVQHVVLNTDASYLQKPFDTETLSRKVRQAFEVVPPSPH